MSSYDIFGFVSISAAVVIGLILLVAPKAAIKKGTEVTDAAIKKNRIIGAVFTVAGATMLALNILMKLRFN